MASIGVNKEEFLKELEALGVEEVRARLASKLYTDLNEKGLFAREWLVRKDQRREAESSRRNVAFQAEQALTASRAADAAERAAEAAERQATTAERATRIAMAALIVAIISGIFSLVALFRS